MNVDFQSEPMTISCCTSILFIYPFKMLAVYKRKHTPQPPHFTLQLPGPREDLYLSGISKSAWMQGGISEKRYEDSGRGGRQFMHPDRHTQVCMDTHIFLASSANVLLQRGGSGQKTSSLITLLIKSHFNILPLQRGTLKEGSSGGDETR